MFRFGIVIMGMKIGMTAQMAITFWHVLIACIVILAARPAIRLVRRITTKSK